VRIVDNAGKTATPEGYMRSQEALVFILWLMVAIAVGTLLFLLALGLAHWLGFGS
jgi:hypothetical protein